MSHPRADLRAAVRAALAASILDITWREDWWLPERGDALPVGGVATPRERSGLIDGETMARTVEVVVVVKRGIATNIEASLDDDSAAIEVAVIPALRAVSDIFSLDETQIRVDHGGNVAVGELQLLFRVLLRTPEGAPET